MLMVSDAWREAFPGAAVGELAIRDVTNPESDAALEQRKQALESQLRSRFSKGGRAAIKALPVIQAYAAYYERFNKTYHVQLQLESVALKGKSIPRVAALVEAMFMAELENLLLTAGHDLATVQEPLRLDVSTGDERYVLLNGQEQVLKPGDMLVSDAQGVISDVIYGPDQRTRDAARGLRDRDFREGESHVAGDEGREVPSPGPGPYWGHRGQGNPEVGRHRRHTGLVWDIDLRGCSLRVLLRRRGGGSHHP